MSDETTRQFRVEDFAGGEAGEGGEEEQGMDERFGAENEVGEGEEFGEGAEEESHYVKNDTETMSVSSSSKRVTEMPVDWLSALPDCLLIHILSFLEMKEAAITSVLSKRWQFLWTELASMVFCDSSRKTDKIRNFVAWVHRALVSCRRNCLECFVVDFRYRKCFASDVDVWVEFAVKRKVTEVELLLNSAKDLYTLPEMMYSNPTLTWLSVRGCIMAPERTIEWGCLTSLSLDNVVLGQHVLEKILSGCPVLCSLYLRECWGFNRLDVKSRRLYELSVEYLHGCNEPSLEISAPYIRFLEIWLDPEERTLSLTNISSVVTANIGFNGLFWDRSEEEVVTCTRELFEKLKHVKKLELGRRYLEVLSMLVSTGWQLPQSMRGCLIVNASRDEESTSCILGLLESSPNLETLVINGYDPYDNPYEASTPLGPVRRHDLSCDLSHLKTIRISDFANPRFGSELLLTLAQILLKRATVLEKMVIRFAKTTCSSTHTSSYLTEIAQTLNSYPRSSENAVILLR